VPVADVVAEEEEVTPAQPGRDGDRNRPGVSVQVADVIVLGDDEALALPAGRSIHAAAQPEDDRALLGRRVRVGVGDLDQCGAPVGSPVPEAAAVPPGRDVADDIGVLVRLVEGPLEGRVVPGRDDQERGCGVSTKQSGQRCDEAVRQRRLIVNIEDVVQLVPQRAVAVGDGHVLRDAG
jgi:hypothetical protein